MDNVLDTLGQKGIRRFPLPQPRINCVNRNIQARRPFPDREIFSVAGNPASIMLFQRGRKDSLNAHPRVKAIPKGSPFDSGDLGPVPQGASLALIGQTQTVCVVAAAATVKSLLAWGSPSAVTRLIIAIVVREAVNAQSGRAVSHIATEVLKGIEPAGANGNSSTTVIAESGIPGISATRSHVTPDMECSRTSVRRLPVDSVGFNSFRKHLSLFAPAACGCSPFKRATIDSLHSSAIAAAHPRYSLARQIAGEYD